MLDYIRQLLKRENDKKLRPKEIECEHYQIIKTPVGFYCLKCCKMYRKVEK